MKQFTEKLEDGSIVVHLEAVEAFLDRCEILEKAMTEIDVILKSNGLNDSLLKAYDGSKDGDEVVKVLLALKQVVAKTL